MTDSTLATLLDELAALDSAQRRELAEKLCAVADACSEVPDGRQTAYALGLLARFLNPP